MTENQKKLKIGFSKDYKGNLTQKVWIRDHADNYVENTPFVAELQYVDYERGRSALNIKWYDSGKNRYVYSGMPLLHSFITSGQLGRLGQVSSTFVFKQQGTSILLTEYKED